MLKQELELEMPEHENRNDSLEEIIKHIFKTEKNFLSRDKEGVYKDHENIQVKLKTQLVEIQTFFNIKEKESKVFLSGSNTQKERKIGWIIDNKEIWEEWKKELNFTASHYLRIVKGKEWLEKLNWLRDNREIWEEWKKELNFSTTHYSKILWGKEWLEKLNWLRRNMKMWIEWKEELNFSTAHYATVVSGSGWLEKLNWLRDNREIWKEWKEEITFNTAHYSEIVRGSGWLEKLNWLKNNKEIWEEWNKELTFNTVHYSDIVKGSEWLEKLNWLRDNREIWEEWKKELTFNTAHYSKIVGGSVWLEKLNWLKNNKEICEEWKKELTFNTAHYATVVSGSGWLEKLNWLKDNKETLKEWGKELNLDASHYSRIVRGSEWLEKLNWLKNNKEICEEWKKEVNFNASHYSRIVSGSKWLEKLNWLRDNSKMWGEWKKRNTTGDILEILTDETEYLTEKIENSLAKIEETGNEVEREQEKYLWEKEKIKENVMGYIRKRNYWVADGFSDSLLEETYPMLYVAHVVHYKSLRQLIKRKGVNEGDTLLFEKFEDWFDKKQEINQQKVKESFQEFLGENPEIKVGKNEKLTFIIKKNLAGFIRDNVLVDVKTPVKVLTGSPEEYLFFEKMSKQVNYDILSSKDSIVKNNSMDFIVTDENVLTSKKRLINSILNKTNNIRFYVVSKDKFIAKKNFDSVKESGKKRDVRLSYFGNFNLFVKYDITKRTFSDNQHIYKISIGGN